MSLVPCEMILDPLVAVSYRGYKSMMFITWRDAG